MLTSRLTFRFNIVQGSVYNDTIRLGTGTATIELIDGGAGTDSIKGTTTDDVIDLTGISILNIENIDGAAGNDTIIGSAGGDFITGGVGTDSLFEGEGADTFSVVGDGDLDTIDGGTGYDTLQGSTFNDAFRVINGLANWINLEAVDGGAGTDDKVVATSGADTLDFAALLLTGIEKIDLSGGNDRVK